MSRRETIAAVGGVVFASSGCLETVSPVQRGTEGDDTTENPKETTKEFSVDDILVQNERDEPVEVTVSITRNSESVFEETFSLDPDKTKTFEDVMTNEREYTITVSADGMTSTRTFDEHRDNAGIHFSVTAEKIESVEIVH